MFYRNGSNVIIGALNESVGTHVVAYSTDDIKYAEIVCTTREYNKIRKLNGFKEIDHYAVEKSDNPKRFYADIEMKIRELKLNDFDPNSSEYVLGKYGTPGYGFVLLKNSDKKVKSHAWNVMYGGAGTSEALVQHNYKFIETDSDAQYEVYKKTGRYPKEPIIKHTWEVSQVDDSHILIVCDGKKKIVKVITDDRDMAHAFVGRPMKSGIKAYGGTNGFMNFVSGNITGGQCGSVLKNIINGAWEVCKESKK